MGLSHCMAGHRVAEAVAATRFKALTSESGALSDPLGSGEDGGQRAANSREEGQPGAQRSQSAGFQVYTGSGRARRVRVW